MNTDFPNRLAVQLHDNPSLLEEMDDLLLSELVGHYYEGELDADDVVAVEAMLETNPEAKAIYERIEAAERFATSPACKIWLENLRNRALPSLIDSSQSAPALTFFDRLSEWMMDLFPSLTLQAAYSDTTEGGVVHKFTSGPYRAHLGRDAAGQWRLLVSTSDADAAKLKVRVEIEPEAPVVSFVAGEPGHFLAEILVSEEMARALQSGRPVFRPVE